MKKSTGNHVWMHIETLQLMQQFETQWTMSTKTPFFYNSSYVFQKCEHFRIPAIPFSMSSGKNIPLKCHNISNKYINSSFQNYRIRLFIIIYPNLKYLSWIKYFWCIWKIFGESSFHSNINSTNKYAGINRESFYPCYFELDPPVSSVI